MAKKVVFIILIFALIAHKTMAMSGCSSMNVEPTTCTYQLTISGTYVAWHFLVTGGTIVSQSQSGTTYTADIYFSTPGAQTVQFAANGNTIYDTYNVNVSACPTTPTTANASRCGDGTVTLTASTNAFSVVRWYDAEGTYLATGNSFTTPWLSTTTIYKADAYYAAGNCASTKVNVTATVNGMPGLISTASASPSSSCGPAMVTLSATGATTGENYVWYDASDNEVTTSLNVSTSSTFYVARQSTANWCTGPKRSVTVSIDTPPATFTVSGGGTYCASGASPAVTLSGSQIGVNYILTRTGFTPNAPVAGTGNALSWTGLPAGTYTVSASSANNLCTASMTGSATLAATPASVGGTLNPAQLYLYGSAANEEITLSEYSGSILHWEVLGLSGWEIVAGTTGATSYTVFGASGSTSVRVQVQSGICPAVSSQTAIVNVYPALSISPLQPVVAYGGTVNLQGNQDYYSYQWSLNNTVIPGATGYSYDASRPGRYTLTVKASSTAPSTSATVVVKATTDVQANLESTTVIRDRGVKANTSLFDLPAEKLAQFITYSDGLGRPEQSIAIGQSPLGHDIVQFSEYSTYGLSEKQYLPYVTNVRDGQKRSTPTAELSTFYTGSSLIAHCEAPWAVTQLANSPLANVREQGAPGTDWQPGTHAVKSDFTLNLAAQVRNWKTIASTSGKYAANLLAVQSITDENGNQVRTFTDKLGRTVLKQVQLDESVEGKNTPWLETYYIYNAFGNLTYQLPPKAVALMTATIIPSPDPWLDLIYKYIYDAAGRLTQKKVPGAAVQYIVYDAYDRPVLMQDGNLRATNEWFFVKYDSRDRIVMTGRYQDATHTTLAAMQDYVTPTEPTTLAMLEEEGTTLYGYTNLSFPITNYDGTALAIHAVNYYDHYDFNRDNVADYSYSVQGLTGEMAVAPYVEGRPTGHMKLIEGTTTWLTSAVFYDSYGHVIQQQSNNHLSATVDNVTTSVYDMEGKVLFTKTQHNGGGSNQLTVLGRYLYDDAGRLTDIYQTLPGGTEQLVARYTYNELGQLIDKKLHEKTSGSNTFLQSIDYRYHERGWLQSINNAQLSSTNNDDSDADADVFGLDMLYELVEPNLNGQTGDKAYWNGNIGAVKWSNPGHAIGTAGQRSYKYLYDKSDKLTKATFQANVGNSNWTQDVGTLNEQMTYDANGNILTLQRNTIQRSFAGGVVSTTPLAIDDLTYTYKPKTNTLQKVEDATANIAGFTNGSNTTDEYVYSADGSLTGDLNKGIGTTGIVYNVLGKPKTITYTDGRKLEYTYDMDGNKLTLKTYAAGSTTPASTVDYVGGFVYENGALSYFGSPDGRVVKKGSVYELQYAIADHQGNTRVLFSSATPAAQTVTATFEDDTNVTEVNDFGDSYPTGGNLSGLELYNHTNGGTAYTYSQLLNGGDNSIVGLAKSYKVYPGDKVKVEAYAKYYDTESTDSNIDAFATALTSAFGVSAGSTGEALLAYNGLNTYGAFIGGGSGNGNNTFPKAFVTILLFDKNFKFLDVAYDQIDGGEQVGLTPKAAHDYLSKEYTVKEAGYAYVYISNETTTLMDVYFDDVKMTYTPTNVLQVNEYYPYGLQTASSWTRDGNSNNFLYNGGTEQNTTTGLYDLAYRNFDPALGRFHQVDPLADSYSSLTPYNYANANPALLNDPSGLGPPGSQAEAPAFDNSFIKDYSGGGQMYEPGYSLINYTPWVGGHITRGSGGNWADGIYNDDWSLHGGSQSYRANRAMGATDLGGLQYFVGGGGARMPAPTNGAWGHYEDYNYEETRYFFDEEGNLRRWYLPVASQRFVASQGDPIFGHDFVDPNSFNFQNAFGELRTEAYYGETFLVVKPITRQVDILRLDINSIAIYVKSARMSNETAQYVMADAFQDARLAVYKAFAEDNISADRARTIFINTLTKSVSSNFPLGSTVSPDTEFVFHGDIPISVVQLINPRLLPTH